MRLYKQFTYEEREKLAQLRQWQPSIAQIALALGRARSTIYRELKRNEAPPGQYWPDTAERKALTRRRRGCILDKNEALQAFVLDKLRCHFWTPEQIAGYLKRRQRNLPSLSHETIYAWIYQKNQRAEKLWKCLPRHKAKRGLRKSTTAGVSRIPGRVSIHARPKSVENRKDFGHWEGDLMSFIKGSQHILVLRERKTMFTLSLPLPSKRAADTSQALVDLLQAVPQQGRKTLTLDNGGEFAAHQEWLKSLDLPSFFCDPYASWQKGGIENTNGRLRRDLPRKTNIKSINREDFYETIDNYNSTPRKKLNYFTPHQVFMKNLSRVALHS